MLPKCVHASVCVCACVHAHPAGASGVAGVRAAAAEEVGLCGHLQRRDDRVGEGHCRSGWTAHTHTHSDFLQWQSDELTLRLCLQCVADSVVNIEEIDTDVVTK